jgi:hypothetical protein
MYPWAPLSVAAVLKGAHPPAARIDCANARARPAITTEPGSGEPGMVEGGARAVTLAGKRSRGFVCYRTHGCDASQRRQTTPRRTRRNPSWHPRLGDIGYYWDRLSHVALHTGVSAALAGAASDPTTFPPVRQASSRQLSNRDAPSALFIAHRRGESESELLLLSRDLSTLARCRVTAAMDGGCRSNGVCPAWL